MGYALPAGALAQGGVASLLRNGLARFLIRSQTIEEKKVTKINNHTNVVAIVWMSNVAV